MQNNTAYQLKITLWDSKPPIWRRILVSPDIKLSELHYVIQAVFGWHNCHLHHFVKVASRSEMWKNPYHSIPRPDDEFCGMFGKNENVDSRMVSLDSLLTQPKEKLEYEYDFGDGWLHIVELEKIIEVELNQKLPLCMKGKMACPPEDCGGIWGYYDLIDVVKDKKHVQHKDAKEWLKYMGIKNFDPEHFSVEEANDNLAKLNKELKKLRKMEIA